MGNWKELLTSTDPEVASPFGEGGIFFYNPKQERLLKIDTGGSVTSLKDWVGLPVSSEITVVQCPIPRAYGMRCWPTASNETEEMFDLPHLTKLAIDDLISQDGLETLTAVVGSPSGWVPFAEKDIEREYFMSRRDEIAAMIGADLGESVVFALDRNVAQADGLTARETDLLLNDVACAMSEWLGSHGFFEVLNSELDETARNIVQEREDIDPR